MQVNLCNNSLFTVRVSSGPVAKTAVRHVTGGAGTSNPVEAEWLANLVTGCVSMLITVHQVNPATPPLSPHLHAMLVKPPPPSPSVRWSPALGNLSDRQHASLITWWRQSTAHPPMH